jgi:hypothetical protein
MQVIVRPGAANLTSALAEQADAAVPAEDRDQHAGRPRALHDDAQALAAPQGAQRQPRAP